MFRHNVAKHIGKGLVGYWPLASGGAVDLRASRQYGSPLDLTNNNTVTRAAGPLDIVDAADFNGSTQYFSRAHDSRFAISSNSPFSVAIWVFADSLATNNRIILDKIGAVADTSSEWQLLHRLTGTTWRFTGVGATSGGSAVATAVDSAVLPTASAWTMLCAGWYPGAVWISVNGRPKEIAVHAPSGVQINQSTDPIEIGRRHDNAQYWDGRMAGFGFWQRALSDVEINWLYNGGRGRRL